MDPAKILVVDDDPMILDLCRDILEHHGFQCITEDHSPRAIQRIETELPDLVITDLSMPELTGMELLDWITQNHPQLPVIILSGNTTIDTAFAAIRRGAKDYVTKPFKPDELCLRIKKTLEQTRLQQENLSLKQQLQQSEIFMEMVGTSRVMQKIFATIERAAPTDASVMIWGESGTGKELVARAIHRASKRANRPFIAVDCVAIPEHLIESELFGYVKGAFTGAHEDREGLLQTAQGGTLFLDEITEMNIELQGKLLRVLQERKFRQVGGRELHDLDVRVIAATNRNPQQAIEDKRLRLDLYYRFNVIPIYLPPLREREDDILHLLHYFLKKFTQSSSKKILGIEKEALNALLRYSWPGNIRELQNIVERMVILCEGPQITLRDIPEEILKASSITSPGAPPSSVPTQQLGIEPILPPPQGASSTNSLLLPCPDPIQVSYHQARGLLFKQFQKYYLESLLTHYHGNISLMAKHSGLDRKSIHRMLKELNIQPKDYRK